MDAYKRQIGEIFIRNKILEVPFYQRNYVWGEEDWKRFLDDITEMCHENEPYFLGSLILKDRPMQGGNEESFAGRFMVVDGQQRLTTLMIFMKVLALRTDDDTTFKEMFLIEKKKLDKTFVALRHSYNDRKAFEHVMLLDKLEDLSGNRIYEAYTYFKENIDIDETKHLSLSLDTIDANLLFVGVFVGEHEDEQQIFDTINSLGVRLTTAELLKNYFFDESTLKDFEKYWKPTFEGDEETKAYWDTEIKTGRITRTLIDNFLYSFLQIKIQDRSLGIPLNEKNLYQKYDRLFHSYRDFIENYYAGRKLGILAELRDYANLFRSTVKPDITKEELPAEPALERITAIVVSLDTSTMLPYVLYILKNVAGESERNAIFGILESYALRRVIIRASNKNYNHFFTETLIGNEILTAQKLSSLFTKMDKDNVNAMPSDTELRDAFLSGHVWQWQATRIIYLIESRIRDHEKHATCLSGIEKYQLEHIMPVKWRDHWGEADNPEERDDALQTLGNFAIIPGKLNASISNADWPTKLIGKGTKGGLKQYASDLDTLNPWLECDAWNEESIQKRGKWLYEKAKEIWPSV
jgi:uncharacterized protein with ParB-like and HNH nuclease domain